jgi:hypothetical protein
MGYRKRNEQEFDDQVVLVFQKTTVEERAGLAAEWLAGDRAAHAGFAQERGLLPMALITGALIDVEHPILVDERGCLRAETLLGCSVLVLQASLWEKFIHRVLATDDLREEVIHSPLLATVGK